ncbi:MAG: YlxR family protein [Deltaproteobacteria bacterium]|nr:YlxR family protein [Deltaproteobacteria bacterium]
MHALSRPVRTCLGCRERDMRAALTRVIARDGRLEVDIAKRAPGRGAWMHARATCIEAFARRGGFVRALRCVIPKSERAVLRARFSEVQV